MNIEALLLRVAANIKNAQSSRDHNMMSPEEAFQDAMWAIAQAIEDALAEQRAGKGDG